MSTLAHLAVTARTRGRHRRDRLARLIAGLIIANREAKLYAEYEQERAK